MNTDNDLAAAKANLVKAASEVDLLEPLREHPYVTMAVAGATGAFMAASDAKLGHIASIIRSVTRFFGQIVAAAESHAAPAPQTKPPSES